MSVWDCLSSDWCSSSLLVCYLSAAFVQPLAKSAAWHTASDELRCYHNGHWHVSPLFYLLVQSALQDHWLRVLECHSVDCIQPCIMPPSCCHHAAPCKIWLLCSSPSCAGLVMVMTHTGSSVGDSQAATSAGPPLAIYPTPSESNHQNCSPNIARIIHHNCSIQLPQVDNLALTRVILLLPRNGADALAVQHHASFNCNQLCWRKVQCQHALLPTASCLSP